MELLSCQAHGLHMATWYHMTNDPQLDHTMTSEQAPYLCADQISAQTALTSCFMFAPLVAKTRTPSQKTSIHPPNPPPHHPEREPDSPGELERSCHDVFPPHAPSLLLSKLNRWDQLILPDVPVSVARSSSTPSSLTQRQPCLSPKGPESAGLLSESSLLIFSWIFSFHRW